MHVSLQVANIPGVLHRNNVSELAVHAQDFHELVSSNLNSKVVSVQYSGTQVPHVDRQNVLTPSYAQYSVGFSCTQVQYSPLYSPLTSTLN